MEDRAIWPQRSHIQLLGRQVLQWCQAPQCSVWVVEAEVRQAKTARGLPRAGGHCQRQRRRRQLLWPKTQGRSEEDWPYAGITVKEAVARSDRMAAGRSPKRWWW